MTSKVLFLFLLLLLFSCEGFKVDLTPQITSNGNFTVSNNEFDLYGEGSSRGKMSSDLEYEWTFNFRDGAGIDIGPCVISFTRAMDAISSYSISNNGCSDFQPNGVGNEPKISVSLSRPTPVLLNYCLRIREPDSGVIETIQSCGSVGDNAPVIAVPVLVTPIEGSRLNTLNNNFSGTCESGKIVNFSGDILGAPIDVPCSGTNTFSTNIQFLPGDGAKQVILRQRNTEGNISIPVNRNLIYDTVASVTVSAVIPPINSLNETSYAISGTCSDDGTNSVVVNITGVSPVSTDCNTGNYSVVMDVSSAADSSSLLISVNHTDLAGNSGNGNRNILKDTIAPTIPEIQSWTWTLSSPNNASNSHDYTPIINLSGASAENGGTIRVFEGAACTDTINGTLQTIASGQTSHSDLGLPQTIAANGTKAFYVVATDFAGNPSSCADISRGYNYTYCPPATLNFTIGSATTFDPSVTLINGATVEWDFGGGNTSSSPSPSFDFIGPGPHNASAFFFCSEEVTTLSYSRDGVVNPLPNVGQLPNLTNLNMGSNNFTGTIPSGYFDNLTQLTNLDFSGSGFSGVLPVGIFDNNPLLNDLRFYSNGFSGNLDVNIFANNPALTYIDIESNNWSGPLDAGLFDNLTALRVLWLRGNNFSGLIPANLLANNTDLRDIYLGGNNFTNPIPANLFANNPLLRLITFPNAGFSGTIPVNLFSNNTVVEIIDFADNAYTSGMVAALFANNASTLENLNFSGNNFSGAVPTDLFTSLTSLETIDMADNDYTSVSRAVFSASSGVETLLIGGNPFTGSPPSDLFDDLTSIETLNMNASGYTTGITTDLFDNLTTLTRLEFTSHNFGGVPIQAGMFDTLTNLEHLNFRNNNYAGPIPANLLDNNTNLEEVYFTSNDFTGSIPTNFFVNNVNLEFISMSDNDISGTLPVGLLDTMPNLREFWVRDNLLTGSIPANFFDNNLLLEDIHMHGNMLSGVLPTNLFINNIELTDVELHNNQFTSGTSLVANTNIDLFNISNNQLSITDVNQILVDFDSFFTSTGSITINNQLPSAPSGVGATAVTNLVGRGWTVTTD